MYIKQKVLIGLCLFIASLGLINILPKKAFADVAATDIRTASYTFRDGSIIVGDFGSSGKVTFVDSNVSDSTRNFEPPEGIFCDPGTIPDQNGVDGGIKFGINIDSHADLTARNISAQIKLGYNSGTVCHGILQNHIINNPSAAAATDFKWSGATIVSLEGQDNSDTFLLGENIKAPYTKRLYISSSDGRCGANGTILLDQQGGNSGIYWRLSDSGPRKPSNISDYKTLTDTGAFDANCYVDGKERVTIAGTKGSAVDSDASNDASDSCESNIGWALAWITCPIVEAGESFAKAAYGTVQGLLSFRVPDDIKNANGQNNVRDAWSIFRTIVTVAVVILMLVMVFSQAIGTGPFEAYTVRKMLPRIAIGVILIQLSWPLLAFVINLVDDLGSGLAQLIYAPFGGKEHLSLIAILGKYNLGTEAFLFSWGTFIGGIITAAVAPFLVMSVVFSVVIAILVALATLIFRQIIIILCLVTAPIALLLWMMPSPGIQKYWKQWSDNFIKVLLMYPIIVLLIAAGQIFALVAGGQNPGLINFIIVIVGFFGPLLMLPKAYTWGGQLMRQSGDLINKGGAKLSEKPKALLSARQQEFNEQKRISGAARLRKWDQGELTTGGKINSFLRGDKFKSGDWDPLYRLSAGRVGVGRRELAHLREKKGTQFRAAAVRAENEEREAALFKIDEEATQRQPGNKTEYFREVFMDDKKRSTAERFAALELLADQGGDSDKGWIMRRGNEIADKGNIEGASAAQKAMSTEFDKLASRKASALFPIMPSLAYYKGGGDSNAGAINAANALKAENFTRLGASATEDMIERLQILAAAGNVKASNGLQQLYTEFDAAMANENIAPAIGPEMRRVVNNSRGGAPPAPPSPPPAPPNSDGTPPTGPEGPPSSPGGTPPPTPPPSPPSGPVPGTTTPESGSAASAPGGAAGETISAESIAQAVARGVREANEADFQRTRDRFNTGTNAGGSFRQNIGPQSNDEGELDIHPKDE